MFEQMVTPVVAVLEARCPDELLDELLVERPGAWMLGVLLDLRDRLETPSAKQRYLQCWERFTSWSQLQRADAVVLAADTQRYVAGPLRADGPIMTDDLGTDVVAFLTNATKVTAGHDVVIARSIMTDLIGVYSALDRGDITWQMARDVADATEHLLPWQRQAVDATMVDRWDITMGIQGWRRKLHREVLKVDTDAEARRQRAVKDRSVRKWRLADGMAAIHAELPAAEAEAVWLGLTGRADQYGEQDRAARAAAMAERDQVNRADTDPDPDRDEEWIDPDTMTGLDTDLPALRTMDQRRADALVEMCTGILGDPDLPRRQGRRPHVNATGGILTLLGLRNDPGELAGYGPITAQHLREIAADADWHRFITAPDTGALISIGTETYRPKQALRDFLVAKEPCCDFPGCGIASSRCDGEHTIPHDDGGKTNEHNLRPRCRRHHRCKTHAGWTVTRLANGCTRWTTPHGIHRTVEPHRLASDDTNEIDIGPPDTD